MRILAECLSRIDPRAHAEPDLSGLDLPDLQQSTIVLKLLWRRYEAVEQRVRILRLTVWLMGLALAIAVAL